LKSISLILLVCVSACSWFGSRRHAAPAPAEITVTGAPAGSIILIDGKSMGDAVVNDYSQVIEVAPGSHEVEIRVGDRIVYREDTDVAVSEHRVVSVLSGAQR
jgi:hypothetical protein